MSETYKIEIDLEPKEIQGEKLYLAKEPNKEKYIDAKKVGDIMKHFHKDPNDLDFVRKATKLFRGTKITIEENQHES